jgi:hypothetical protein
MNKGLTILVAILFIAVAVLGGLYVSANIKVKNAVSQAAQTQEASSEKAQAQETTEKADETPEADESAAAQDDSSRDTADLDFAAMPREYWFSAGAGGWSTLLKINDDGSFLCTFSDRDYKTIYYSVAEGRFSKPMKNDNDSYRIKIEEMTITNDTDKFNYYDEEAEYIESDIPYGINNTDVFIIYAPGTLLTQLPEDSRFWLHLDSEAEELPEGFYALYNPSEGYIFAGDESEGQE